MKYLHYDLGQRRVGETVVVTLSGDSMNVRLLDAANFSSFKQGRRHTYHGGHVTQSPYRIGIPRAGHWYVVIDRGGYAGRVEASVRVEGGVRDRILPPASSPSPPDLGAIRRNFAEAQASASTEARPAEAGGSEPSVDVFISHASEDKDDIVRPLAAALQNEGLTVWYDEYALRIGDSLRRKIDQGLATCRFGVVVLSKAFFGKNWPQYELDGLVTREQSGGRQLILPVWHNLSKDELVAVSPSLADKVALRTADFTVVEIAAQIADAVSSPEAPGAAPA